MHLGVRTAVFVSSLRWTCLKAYGTSESVLSRINIYADSFSSLERSDYKSEASLMERLGKLGERGACISGAENIPVFRRPCGKVPSRHPWLQGHLTIHGRRTPLWPDTRPFVSTP